MIDHASLWIILLLGGVVIFQYVQIHKLIDKLMSRNYAEYEQAKSPTQPLTAPSVVIPEDREDISGTFGGISPL